MPTFEIDPAARAKPRHLRQRASEAQIERLLLLYPRLLGHETEAKQRGVVWFWKRPNGPGDLFGFDDHGRLVIVEVKKRFGAGDEAKSARQLRAAARRAQRLTREEIRAKYSELQRKYSLATKHQLPLALERLTARRLRSGLAKPFLYAVAGHFTGAGQNSASRKGRRRLRRIQVVMLFEVRISDGRSIVTTERLHSFSRAA